MNLPLIYVVIDRYFENRAEAYADRDALRAEGYAAEVEEYPAERIMSQHQWDMYLRGCDDPNTLHYEMQACFEDDCIDSQDAMEARGGPKFLPLADAIPF